MSYNPSRIQRRFDKLCSAWQYLNWECDSLDLGVQAAMAILSEAKLNTIREAYRNGEYEKLFVNKGHERSREKWSKAEQRESEI